jgi:cytoskeletal protein CcmA (bactofilin family)
VLGKYLGKDTTKHTPPKNQIEVVCPVCGAAQYEPRLVVTTLCRGCGEHLRIVGRKILASSKLNPVPSAVFPAELPPNSRAFDRDQKLAPHALLPSEPAAPEEGPTGLGSMMGFNPIPETSPASSPSHRPPSGPLRSSMAAKQPEPALPPGPLTTSTFQKMKEQGYYRQQYFKDVECFDCRQKFKVGRSAKSTQCPACGVHICLEDFDINVPSTQSILTRGDVLIRKNGNVSAQQIKCRDLKVYGMVSAQIECAGDLTLRMSGTVIGEVRCRRLVVEKGSDIQFHNTVYADEVELQARVTGNVHCSGRVVIGPLGLIHGDVTARAVSIEPGGQLDGAMNILRTTSQRQSVPSAFSGSSPASAAPAVARSGDTAS